MQTFNTHSAKAHFSELINQVLMGEDVVIMRGHKPVARLVPYEKNTLPPRNGGQLKGLMHISEDFEAPLPQELMHAFYHESQNEKKEKE